MSADATLTVTLHLWWLWAYLAIGLVLWLPLEWLAWRSLARPRDSYWRSFARGIRGRWWLPLTIVCLWPVAVWEEVRP